MTEVLGQVLLILYIFICLRIALVCFLNTHRLKYIKTHALQQLENVSNKALVLAKEGKEWKHLYDEFDKIDHFESVNLDNTIRRVFDLTKWTYRDMFGEDM